MKPKQAEEKFISITKTEGSHMSHWDAKQMARAVQGVENWTIWGNMQRPEMIKDAEQFMTCAKMMTTKRW